MVKFVRVALRDLGFTVAETAYKAGGIADTSLQRRSRVPKALQELQFCHAGNGQVQVRKRGTGLALQRMDREAATGRTAGGDKPGAETKLCGTSVEPGTCSEPSEGRQGH